VLSCIAVRVSPHLCTAGSAMLRVQHLAAVAVRYLRQRARARRGGRCNCHVLCGGDHAQGVCLRYSRILELRSIQLA